MNSKLDSVKVISDISNSIILFMKKIIFPLLSGFLFLQACSSGPMIEGFNSDQWIADSKGCQGERKSMAVAIINNKEKIKKYKYEQALSFLGRPDIVDRYNRGKKNIVYYIEPGVQCEKGSDYKAEKLVLEIGPLGEINIVRTEKSF